MVATWRDTKLMRKIKQQHQYVCEECGSTENIQAHHYDGKNNDKLVVLCGKCHALKHPELAIELFINKKKMNPRQLWFPDQEFKGRKPCILMGFNGHVLLKRYERVCKKPLSNMLPCRRCKKETHHDKQGIINGKQRYFCTECGSTRY